MTLSYRWKSRDSNSGRPTHIPKSSPDTLAPLTEAVGTVQLWPGASEARVATEEDLGA